MMRPEDVPEATAVALAEALNRYETSGLCPLRGACELCDCGADMQTLERTEEDYRRALDRARHALAAVVPDIQAQALREAADVVKKHTGRLESAEGADEVVSLVESVIRHRAARLTETTEGRRSDEL